MKLLKGLLLIGLIKLFLLSISTCSDKGFDYKWQDIIIQTMSNKETTDNENLSQSGFGLKINLINSKSARIINFIPQMTNNAYAGIIFHDKYYNINSIKKINVLFLPGLDNTGDIQIVTDDFFPEKYNSEDQVLPPIEQLIDQLNNKKFEPVESFDLFLEQPFEQNLTGRFIVEIKLSDDRVLSDTTHILNLSL